MDTKTITAQTKKAVAIGLCASLVGGVAAPVLSTTHDAYAAVAGKPDVNTAHGSIVQFKDPVLKKYILFEMKKQNLINQSAQDITEEDALKVKELSIYISPGDDKIQSIEGIENFKNLTELDLHNNQISNLKPLANLTNLTSLDLSDNQISDITPLANLTNLTSLNLHDNYKISDLKPLAGLTNLTSLDLSFNQISNLTPLKGLTNLTSLNLHNNQISNLKPLAGLTNLTSLDLSFNQISDITPLKGLTNLTSLNLYCNTHATDLKPLANLTNLTTLDLVSTQATDLKPLANLTNLKELHIGNYKITDVTPLKGLTNLTSLNLSFNSQLTDITPLKGLTNLKDLALNRNSKISDLTPLAGMTNLTRLSIWQNQISDITPLASLTKLTSLNLSANQISNLKPLASLTKLTSLNLHNNQISNLKPLANLTNLTSLDLSDNQISNLKPLANLTNLTSLNLSDNQISDITPLKGLTNLTKLNIESNKIQNLECLSTLKSVINATEQRFFFQPTTATVDLKKEIKGFSNVAFGSDENITNGVLTHKKGMKNPYQVKASDKNGKHEYSATIDIDFSNVNKEIEIQTENISEELQKLLDGYNAVKDTDNYKNADDNLKQVYDKAITDGQKVYDKLSSTPEQVKQAQQNIQSALRALNGDKKAQAIKDQLSTATQQITSLQEQLEKAKQQGVADASTIQSLTQQLQQTKQQLENLKHDKTLSDQQKQAEIDNLNGQITELGKQIEKLTQENTSLKGQIATLQATVARLTQEANQCHVSDGAKAQELEKVKQQLTQAQSDLEKLKQDKTKSDTEKQKEIDKLNAKIAELEKKVQTCSAQPVGGAIVAPLVNEKPSFDIEKYKREHPDEFASEQHKGSLPGSTHHTDQMKPDAFTQQVHDALQKITPTGATTQDNAKRTDDTERLTSEQNSDAAIEQSDGTHSRLSVTVPENQNSAAQVNISLGNLDKAENLEITYTPAGEHSQHTFYAHKTERGKWILLGAPDGTVIDECTGVVHLPASALAAHSQVHAVAKDKNGEVIGTAQAKLDQSKFPQTGDNSLLTLLSTFAGALVLVLGCFARKKQFRNKK